MPVPVEVLNDLAATLRISAAGAAQPVAGQPVTAGIVPPLDQLQVTDVLNGNLNLTWVTKDVRYNAATLEPSLLPADLNPRILGGIPLGGVSPLPGVPGVLGQLAGTIPLSSAASIPVGLEVEWSVRHPSGAPLTPGTDFLAPAGLTSPGVNIIFAPVVR
ncbi:MAG TPA: hypothetical protein VHG08_18040, partial [Longimicrobium sp.]|nr:hypothetical protein [Longimicrobium sp.]